jgi:hypothetical protein
MAECIRAMHRMEERYSRLILEFCSDDAKESIYSAIDTVSEKMKVKPDSVLRSDDISGRDGMIGEIYVEFDDDYDKTGGDYHEALLKELNLTLCD